MPTRNRTAPCGAESPTPGYSRQGGRLLGYRARRVRGHLRVTAPSRVRPALSAVSPASENTRGVEVLQVTLPDTRPRDGDRQLVVDAQLPLAPRKHGEGLSCLGFATEDSSHCLTTRPARRQSGLSIDLSEQLPSTLAQVLEDDVATGVRTHGAILVRHKSRAIAGDSRSCRRQARGVLRLRRHSRTLAQATARSQDRDLCRGHRVRVAFARRPDDESAHQPNLTWVRRGSRVGQRSGAAVQATQMPFSCTTLPSSSMRPPKRRSLTMSQWIAETFVPPM